MATNIYKVVCGSFQEKKDKLEDVYYTGNYEREWYFSTHKEALELFEACEVYSATVKRTPGGELVIGDFVAIFTAEDVDDSDEEATLEELFNSACWTSCGFAKRSLLPEEKIDERR